MRHANFSNIYHAHRCRSLGDLFKPRPVKSRRSLRIFDRKHLLARQFRHGEHVYSILLEDVAHGIITHNVPLVSWILKIIAFDMLPETFGDFGTRELLQSDFQYALTVKRRT